MLPSKPDETVRVETSLRADDYQILARVATARRTSVAALIRRLIYDHVQPMAAAQLEREQRSLAEARERRALAEWNQEDPVRRHEAMIDDAINGR